MFHFFGERGFSFSCSLFSVFFLASSLCTHLLLKCFSFWSLHHSGGCWFPIEFLFSFLSWFRQAVVRNAFLVRFYGEEG